MEGASDGVRRIHSCVPTMWLLRRPLGSLIPSSFLSRQLTALIREFLVTLRALIDWYLDRLDRGPREPEVEDIRID